VLQCVAVCCSVLQFDVSGLLCRTLCCSVLQCVAVCCSVSFDVSGLLCRTLLFVFFVGRF